MRAVNFTSKKRTAASLVFSKLIYIIFAQVFNPDLFNLLIILIRA